MSRVVLLLLLIATSFDLLAQDVCVRARKIFDRVSSTHVQPRKLDDAYSEDLFSSFFHTLDGESKLFISKDTGTLVRYRRQLDDKNQAECDFVDNATVLFRQRALDYTRFVDSLLSHPLNLSNADQLPSAIKYDLPICSTKSELRQRVARELRLSVLMSMYRQAAFDSTNLVDQKAFAKFEPTARQRIRKNALAELNRLVKDDAALKKFVSNSYLKSIPKVFDPHSDYYSPDEAQSFSERLNPEALSFGIKLEETTPGDVKVSNVVPGGPAWNSNQVNKGDVLVGLKWNKSGEYVDLADLERELVDELLNRSDEISANITLRKPTGEVREVKLVKQKLENEDNIVSGYVLQGKDKKRKIGYISLPGFFTDDNPQSNGCAVAVTKELIKLKGESIEGLILDLRFNGGGSLYEAIELTGLFIDVGPVGIIEPTNEAPITLKDSNMGLVYDGPLVVMVNGASASASEIVAGALQDYKRAIIAGSTTFGKATGQAVQPIDDKDVSKGFLKVTDMRIYHVDGTTHQMKGVTPDFTLPDFYSKMIEREDQQPFALPAKTITKKTYYKKWPGYPEDIIKSATENDLRSEKFTEISKIEKLLTDAIPLESKSFVAYMQEFEKTYRSFAHGNTEQQASYNVSNSMYDASVLQGDPYHAEMNRTVINQIRASIYIQEVYQLLDNIITKKQ